MGVWIEIFEMRLSDTSLSVTPFVGVWIEIARIESGILQYAVTPFVGVWIEIFVTPHLYKRRSSHSLRGSVD